jgi:ABC-type transporter Mla MlaB component
LLRITVQDLSQPTTLKLEGQLKGPWVDETERIWRTCSSAVAAVDLRDVTSVDAKGKELLARMLHQGVDLVADTPMMRYVVEQAAKNHTD